MSDNIIQLNEDLIKNDLKDLVRSSVEETLNALLDKEADELISAQKYERSPEHQPETRRKNKQPRQRKRPPQKERNHRCKFDNGDFPAEFDELKTYEVRQKLRSAAKPPTKTKKQTLPQKEKVPKIKREIPHSKSRPVQEPAFLNPVADYLPIAKIQNGIIYTKDHRFVKVVEIVPINFMLRSAMEQRSIIYSFISYLKISPVKLQFKVLTRRADINRHMNTVRQEMALETNPQCQLMQEDYLQFVQQISSREAVTRRFFLIFEYEPWNNTRRSDEEGEAIASLQSAVHTASAYLRQCGNEVIIPENEDEFTVDILYNLLCRNESAVKPLSEKVKEVAAQYRKKRVRQI